MELAHADIDPHDANPRVEERVAGEPKAADIIVCGEPLVGDVDVDVSEIDDIADVGRAAVEFLLRLALRHGENPPRLTRYPGIVWRKHRMGCAGRSRVGPAATQRQQNSSLCR